MIKIPRLCLLLVLSVVIGAINSCTNTAPQKPSSVQTLLIADNGFSGSSVNVLAGVKQTVFTSGKFQYVAFYNADKQSNPFITSYWADSPGGVPGFRIVYDKTSPLGGMQWQQIKAPPVIENFELSGQGTKKPPISRAVLLVDESHNKSTTQHPSLHLIYRDDFNNGFVMAASLKNLAKPEWQQRVLVARDMDAWEPSLDSAQWHQHQQAHLLLQPVGQDDGNDAKSLQLKPSKIELLVWEP